jgi:hypothetical protein
MKRSVLVIAFTACLTWGIAWAAWPVIDVAAIAKLVDQIHWMEKQYNQIVKEYEQLVWSAKQITNKGRWKATFTRWRYPSATNTYGTTARWMAAATTGLHSLNGYSKAVIDLQKYGPLWAVLTADQQNTIDRNYATVELSDGASVTTLETLGALRGTASAVENAISQLEEDSLSDVPELNTEVGVLNKINAAALINIRNSQDSNKLLASLLEHDLIQAKAHRDAQTQSFNHEIALRQLTPELHTRHMTGSAAILVGCP